jgi:hypothetical protein
MKIPVIIAALVVTVFSGCSRHNDIARRPDPGIQTALDELTRLKSMTEVGLTYGEYSDRVLTGKGNIDVALQHSNDEAAKPRIKAALGFYVAARNEWKGNVDNNLDEAPADMQTLWHNADAAAQRAFEYAFADAATRKGIDQRDAESLKIASETKVKETVLQSEDSKVSAEIEAVKKQLQEAAAQKYADFEKQQAADAAEREKKRRYAPEGSGFTVNPVPVTTADTVTTIPPGTPLTIVAKNPNGTVHVKLGEFETDLPPSEITNDRDLAATLRANEQNEQVAIRQWRLQQAAAIAEAKQAAAAQPTPTPEPAADDDDSSTLHVKPDYVSPLERKAY